ncbi:hypothetical protein AAG593_04895 [Citromicrobium bathyomarinum]
MSNPRERTELCDFLKQLRDTAETPNANILLDFSPTEAIASSGAVFLIGELDRALANQKTLIQARRSSVPLVEEVLQQIGIYEKLGIECDINPTSESVIHWQVASGTLAEGDKSGTILESYEGRLPEGLTKGLYDGLVEAMTNTIHHAYPDNAEGRRRRRNLGRRWWMLSQERDGELTVAICDLGIGIPRSLPRSKTYEANTVREFWRNTGLDQSDASAISVAVQIGRTRTGLKQRGFGLADIVSSANEAVNGRVLITSNKGIFVAKDGDDSVYNHRRSVNGTLIHWAVPIAQESGHDDDV